MAYNLARYVLTDLIFTFEFTFKSLSQRFSRFLSYDYRIGFFSLTFVEGEWR